MKVFDLSNFKSPSLLPITADFLFYIIILHFWRFRERFDCIHPLAFKTLLFHLFTNEC